MGKFSSLRLRPYLFAVSYLLLIPVGVAWAQTKSRSKPAEPANPGHVSAETKTERSSKKLVMVPDFDARGIYHWWQGNWDIGSLFSNSLMGPLSRTDGYEVVERGRTKDVLAEQTTTENERFSQPSITKAGRLLGADYILFGDLLDFSRKKGKNPFVKEVQVSIRLSARLVSVATGKVYKSAEVTYLSPKDREWFGSDKELNPNDPEFLQSLFGKAITEAAIQTVSQLTGEPGATQTVNSPNSTPGGGNKLVPERPAALAENGFVADITGNTVIINVGSGQGVKVGMLFALVRVVKEVRDPQDQSKIILRKTEEIARIKITSVEKAASEGTVVSGNVALLKVGSEVVRVN